MDENEIQKTEIPDPSIKPPTYDVEGTGISDDLKKEKPNMGNLIMCFLQENCGKFFNWIKKSIAMMIIFILIGCAGGIYISKIVYDFRMKEITLVGGFICDKQIYDVKLRP